MEHEKCKLPHWIPKPLPNRRPGCFIYKGRHFIYEVETGLGSQYECYRTPRDFQQEKKDEERGKIRQKKESLYKRMFGELHTQENDIKFNELLKERYKRVTGEYINPVLDDLPEWLFDEKNGNLWFLKIMDSASILFAGGLRRLPPPPRGAPVADQ